MTLTAPKHLRRPTARWWLQVASDYDLEAHHICLLTLAAQSWDRAEQARVALVEHGLTFEDRFRCPHARPEVAIERDSRIAFARLLRELALDVETPADARGPAIVGLAGRAAHG